MSVRQYAEAEGRDYLTPEDVGAALEAGEDATAVRLEVLEAIGRRLGIEDASLCAFLAWRGVAEP